MRNPTSLSFGDMSCDKRTSSVQSTLNAGALNEETEAPANDAPVSALNKKFDDTVPKTAIENANAVKLVISFTIPMLMHSIWCRIVISECPRDDSKEIERFEDRHY